MALFALFSLALLLVQSRADMNGYTSATGSMMNLILYLLPLMALILGSFSLTGEKEEGGWRLLASYPLRSRAYIWGKYIGLTFALVLIAAFGFGLSGLAGAMFGLALPVKAFVRFVVFAVLLIVMFLGLSAVVGSLCRNRWQALTYGVGIWFFLILGWPTLLLSVLGFLPYLWIKPALVTLVLFNPAELNRLFLIVKMGGGSILGPDYYRWVEWIEGPSGSFLFVAIVIGWIVVCMELAIRLWERGRRRE